MPDLLACGDIESNPGPRIRGQRKHAHQPCFSIWNLNTRAGTAAWELLSLAADKQIPIVTMQEVRMFPNEVLAFKRHAWNLGYVTLHIAGPTLPVHRRGERTHGGVITLIKRSVPHAHAFAISGNGGQAVACWVTGTLVINVYVAHHEDRTSFYEELHASFRSIASQAQFVAIGDWNCEPHENPMVCTLEMYNGHEVAPSEPTRWEGRYVIDYAICNLGHANVQLSLLPEALSDHRLLQVSLPSNFRQQPQTVLQPTIKYAPPNNVGPDAWSQFLTVAWQQQQWNFSGQIDSQQQCDAVWLSFLTIIERCMQQATSAANHGNVSHAFPPHELPPSKTRPKGSPAKLVTVAKHCSKHAEKHLPELRIRQLRRVLARLREIQRVTALGNSHPDFETLMTKCRRIVHLSPDHIDNHVALVLSLIEKQQTLAKQERIQSWKHELRSSQQRSYRWLRGTQEPLAMNLHNGAQPAQTMQQCLQLLKAYWSSIWNRTCPHYDETVAALQPHLGPVVPSAQWEPLSPEMLFDTARSQKGKSAGLDGFSGTEVAYLPLVVWQDVATLFHCFETSGYVPSEWSNIKQVHIPKPGKGRRDSDNAVDVASLRPISVLSVWFRIFASARWNSVETQRWVASWWPREAFGGRKRVSIAQALHHILLDAENDRFLAAFDYSLAFDMTDPALVLHVFQHKGMPKSWLRVLSSVWLNQRRLLQYGNECLDRAVAVQHSLPQGDPWAMAAMTALLLAPLHAIRSECPNTRNYSFVDDRTVTAPTLPECLRAETVWKRWSRILGLRENESKTQYYHRTESGRREFLMAEIDAQKISASPQILGACLIGTQKRSLTQQEMKRLEKARKTADRCACLPLHPREKLQYVAATALPQAAFGWFAKRPAVDDLKPFERAVKRCTWKHESADPNLARILRGHSVDLQFRIASDQIAHLWRSCHSSALVPQWNSPVTSMGNLIKEYAGWLNWKPTAVIGVFDNMFLYEKISFVNPRPQRAIAQLDQLKHCLRESWRHMLFSKWQRTNRVDAKFCRDSLHPPVYQTERCALARQHAFDSAHTFAIMAGGFVSPYRLVKNDRGRKYPVRMGTCPSCQSELDFMHWCWNCPDIESDVASLGGCPRDPLLARLGWPCVQDERGGVNTLLYLADRRATAIQWRLVHDQSPDA